MSQEKEPGIERAAEIAKVLGVSVDYLLTGIKTDPHAHAPNGKEIAFSGDVISVPILNQQVAAGRGKDVLENAEEVGQLPFLAKMLRGFDSKRARALQVKGDSMTGVGLFGGDLVVFVPGLLDDEGIYVVQLDDKLLVKRVFHNQADGTIHIMSENPKYPEIVMKANSERLIIAGKVLGWVHAHPY
jgi:phage repressor protein C with HTH and peptisase S24 domain